MLYLVATPIGNLGDMSDRAKRVLQDVDLVACEDTRTSGQLFSLLGIQAKAMTPYHEHNADKARPALIQKLKKGVDVALVSDAGTPLISDPGYKLVRACYESGIAVTAVPGANAVLTALQLSGLPSNAFYFGGFLPPKTTARKKALSVLSGLSSTLIFYETAPRLVAVLSDMRVVFGNRLVAVVRELTKKFEQVRRGSLDELVDYYSQEGAPKGEIVLVVEGVNNADVAMTDTEVSEMIQQTRLTHSARDTAALVAVASGRSKKEIYQMVLIYDKG